ncbi:uncharacterized protein LOC123032426 [Varanus komodoensis]|uniref:uncharacterized protein LOC123032426 n=1 Tax=Varanus komodoensis TaxID=61221 RepID=UPI001CF7BFA9|nr:uncharacterized protein LOC123032426 [Varanus komodoensis]
MTVSVRNWASRPPGAESVADPAPKDARSPSASAESRPADPPVRFVLPAAGKEPLRDPGPPPSGLPRRPPSCATDLSLCLRLSKSGGYSEHVLCFALKFSGAARYASHLEGEVITQIKWSKEALQERRGRQPPGTNRNSHEMLGHSSKAALEHLPEDCPRSLQNIRRAVCVGATGLPWWPAGSLTGSRSAGVCRQAKLSLVLPDEAAVVRLACLVWESYTQGN